MATGKNIDSFNCTSCQGKLHKCLKHSKEGIAIKFPSTSHDIKVNGKNWRDIIKEYHRLLGNDKTPEWFILQSVNLCPIPLFSEFSFAAYSLYHALNGFGNISSAKEYYDKPALYMEIATIINSETARLSQYEQK